MRISAASTLRIVSLLIVCASVIQAQPQPIAPPTSVTVPASSIANPGDAGVRAHTNVQYLGSGGGIKGTPQFYGPPFSGYYYETPASLGCIYGLTPAVAGCNPYVAKANPSGGSRALAVVDAYDNPNAYSDLQYFSGQFGLPAINPTSFIVVFAPPAGPAPGSCSGPPVRPPSAKGTGWDVEESLDVQWAHAMAPFATLFLVEAQSNLWPDLLCAVSVASSIVSSQGGGQVSMSFGSGEWPGELTLDPIFTFPNVVYFASAGDGPGVSYPAASPFVVSVGGTTTSRNAATGNFRFENTWQSTGGGISQFEARPSYQTALAPIVGSFRGTPDVAAVANPFTGVWVFDSLTFGGPAWFVVGGTSASAPIWAGIVNAAGSTAANSIAELTKLYSDPRSDFIDITIGVCGPYMGQVAAAGFDLCSGLGSPRQYVGK